MCVCVGVCVHARIYMPGEEIKSSFGRQWEALEASELSRKNNLSVHKMKGKVDSKSQEISQGGRKVRLWNGTRTQKCKEGKRDPPRIFKQEREQPTGSPSFMRRGDDKGGSQAQVFLNPK